MFLIFSPNMLATFFSAPQYISYPSQLASILWQNGQCSFTIILISSCEAENYIYMDPLQDFVLHCGTQSVPPNGVLQTIGPGMSFWVSKLGRDKYFTI